LKQDPCWQRAASALRHAQRPGFQEQVAQKILTNMGNLYQMPGFSLTLLYLFLVLYARPNRLHREIFYAILSQRATGGETARMEPAANCAKLLQWNL
jgi:hypothetical protein